MPGHIKLKSGLPQLIEMHKDYLQLPFCHILVSYIDDVRKAAAFLTMFIIKPSLGRLILAKSQYSEKFSTDFNKTGKIES